MGMELIQMELGILQANCYIIGDPKTKEAVIIDPGYPDKELLDWLQNEEWKIRGIWLTHGHFDHIGAVPFLKDQLGVQVRVHSLENEYLENPELNLSASYSSTELSFSGDHQMEDGDTVSMGNHIFHVIHVPGHTTGSVCYYEPKEKVLFSGDVLFRGSIGRTDLPKGSLSDLMNHIKEKLLVLPEDTVVYPGHGPATTIEEEKKSNSYLSDQWYETN